MFQFIAIKMQSNWSSVSTILCHIIFFNNRTYLVLILFALLFYSLLYSPISITLDPEHSEMFCTHISVHIYNEYYYYYYYY